MTSIDIKLDGDGCWPDLTAKQETGKVVWNARLAAVSLLPDGEVSDGITGAIKRVPIVTIRFELPDGTTALAQAKLDMLESIVRAFKGRLEYLAESQGKRRARLMSACPDHDERACCPECPGHTGDGWARLSPPERDRGAAAPCSAAAGAASSSGATVG